MFVRNDFSLKAFNTFGLDVRAKVFAEYDNVEQLKELLERFRAHKLLNIGRGSNLLFADDFDGVVLHSAIRFIEGEEQVSVGAGVEFDKFAGWAVENGLWGAENLSYIPGEVGASAVQNIGAYGVEVKDIIERVHTVEISSLEECVFDVSECSYGYRESIFKTELAGQYIVTAVDFKLSKQPRPKLDYGNIRQALQHITQPSLSDIRKAIIDIRRLKLPEVSEMGSAGSFFKNPIISAEEFEQLQRVYPTVPNYVVIDDLSVAHYKIPAAWLIEQCGLKGKKVGGAQVYERQPLVIVNTGNASAKDIISLAELVQQSVRQRFNIVIQPEVNYIY